MPHTVTQINQIITREKYPYYCLQNEAGAAVIPWNTNKPGDKAHLKKILSNLDKSSSLPDGVYFVITAQSKHPKALKMKYDFVKGNPAAAATDEAAAQTFTGRSTMAGAPQLPAGYTFSDLLKLTNELGELRAAVAAKDVQIKQLEADYEELEDELAATQTTPAAAAPGLGQAATELAQFLPMIQAVFNPPPAAGMAEQAPAAAPGKLQITYEQIFNLLKDRPDIIQKLETDLQNYYDQQSQQHPESQQQEAAATASE